MYRKLAKALRRLDVDQKYLGNLLGVTQSTISRRFTGEIPWNVDEMYKIMEIINEPPEKLSVYFPKKPQEEQEN